MNAPVKVMVRRVTSGAAPPSTQIDFDVRNDSAVPVWLVDDGWLIWSQSGNRVELSLARGEMRKGSAVYGYFPPAVARVDPGKSVSRTIRLTWPLRLDRLWNTSPQAAPAPGTYEVSVRVGFGLSTAPDAPGVGESVEAPVLRWQHQAVSDPVAMTVPRY